MNMKKKMLLLFLSLFLFGGVAYGEGVEPFYEFSSGDWTGIAYKNTEGEFSHCGIATEYAGQVTVAIVLSHDYNIVVGLSKPGWEFPPDAAYEITVGIDENSFGAFPAYPKDSNTLLILVGNRDDVFGRLRLGYRLSLSTQEGEFFFSLKGTNDALKKVKECVDLAAALKSEQAKELNPPESLPLQPPEDPSLDENKRIIHEILVASGLEDVVFIDPKEVDLGFAKYAWMSGNFYGAWVELPSVGMSVDEFSQVLIGHAASGCAGAFASQAFDSVLAGNARIKSFYAACSGQDELGYVAGNIVELCSTMVFVMNASKKDPTSLQALNEKMSTALQILFSE
jgi:hypothetical protein